MGCLDENRAVALLEGQLSAAEAERVHEHVADCSDCRRLVAELARVSVRSVAGEAMAATVPQAIASAAPRAERSQIGRYRLLEKLGQGGMGAVFAAEDPELERRVAIKLLHGDAPDATERLLREARAMAKLRHPNVVTVYEVGRDGDDVFVAMELIDGVTLREWLKGEHDWRDRLDMLAQAGRGLAAAHAEGLIHRDFKPENVMVGRDGRAQVLDFGLAKAAATPAGDEPPDHQAVPVVDLTQSGALVGTPAYMAPEQLRLDATDERTDQFAFCVSLFEALHGARPFAGDNLKDLAEAVTSGALIDQGLRREVPADVQAAIVRGLSVDPGDRFPDMEALLRTLTARRRRRRWIAPAAALAVAATLGTVWLGADRSRAIAVEPADPRAAILAASDLPELLDDPLPGDPLGVTVHRLSNGLTVYISPNRKKPRISTRMIVRAGSRHNPPGAGGLAHMVEHMMFKGTGRLGTLDYEKESVHLERLRRLYAEHAAATSDDERASLLDKIDAETVAASRYALPKELMGTASLLGIEQMNGFTDHDTSTFVADVPSHRFALWARLEGERWSNPVFRTFHAEVGAIFAEKRKLDSMSLWAGKLTAALYGSLFADHPYAELAIGSYDDILAEPFSALERFFDTWYVPNNAALLLAGDIDPQQALPILERELGRWKPRALPRTDRGPAPPMTRAQDRSVASEDERMIVVAWRTGPAGHADEDALTVMSELVRGGGGIAETVAAGRLAAIDVWSQSLDQGGFWSIIARPKPGQSLDEALAVVDEIVAALAAGDFEPEQLDAVMGNYRVGLARLREENGPRLEQMAYFYRRRATWRHAAGWESRLAAISTGDVIGVAKRYLTGVRAVIRVEPGETRVAPVTPPAITPLEFPSGRSAFAEELLSAEVVDLPLRFVWHGRDYERRDTPGGPVIAVENRDSDLFEVELRWALGSRAAPALCAALAALDQAGPGERGLERKRRWYARAIDVSTRCDVDATAVTFSGIDRDFDWASGQVLDWLDGDGLTEEGWARSLEAHLEDQRARRTRSGAITDALDQLAARGPGSDHRIAPGPSRLAAATVGDARAALRRLLATRRSTLYFGPRDIASVGAASPEALDPPPDRPPRRYQGGERPRLFLADTGAGKAADVRIRIPLGPIDELGIPLAEMFATYLSDGTSGRLPEAIREARGLSYAVIAGVAIPERAIDDASLVVNFTAEPDQLIAAIDLALEVVRRAEISDADFERARRRTEERYRSHWIAPRELPRALDGWRRRGLEADPRPAQFTRLGRIDRDSLARFAAEVGAAPVTISVAGTIAGLDRARLDRLGDVRIVSRGELFAP